MYEKLIHDLRYKAEFLRKANRDSSSVHNSFAETMSQAADAIERLIAFNAMWQGAAEFAKENKPKWIPVTERLPDNIDEEVLVCNEEYEKSFLGFVTVAIYDGSGWLECWQREKYVACVTHWMPLPEPPKEE